MDMNMNMGMEASVTSSIAMSMPTASSAPHHMAMSMGGSDGCKLSVRNSIILFLVYVPAAVRSIISLLEHIGRYLFDRKDRTTQLF